MSGKIRVAELDLLRFVAATMVVVYHYTYGQILFPQWARYGYLGVELFFLISGFVILWSAEGRTAAQFAKSRFLRLYPMFWIGVAITLLVLTFAGRSFSYADILANLTLLPGYLGAPMIDGVYWTLAVEFKFYVLMFFAVLLGQMKHIEQWLYAWLIGLLAAAYLQVGSLESLTIFPHGYFFVGGAVCYLIRSRGVSWLRLSILTVCAGASMYEAAQGRGDFTHDPLMADASIVAAAVAVFYVVLLAISIGKIRVPNAALLSSLGAITYPLYLLHNQIGKVLLASLPGWAGLVVTLTIVYALAWVCARWLEPTTRNAVSSMLTLPRLVRQ